MGDSTRTAELSDSYVIELIDTINEKAAELSGKGLRPAYVKLPVSLKHSLYLISKQDILRDSPIIKFMGLKVIFSYEVNNLDDIVVMEDPNELLSFNKYNGQIPMRNLICPDI